MGYLVYILSTLMIYLTIIIVVLIVCATVLIWRKYFGHIYKWKFIQEKKWTDSGWGDVSDKYSRIYECEICGKSKIKWY